jgi:LIM domain kinase 1
VRRVLNDVGLTSLLSWGLRIRMAHDISLAMHYLHSRNIVHRDLKSANVLVTSDLRCKVTDFGNSRLVEPSQRQGAGGSRQVGGRQVGRLGVKRQLSRPLTMKFNFGGWIAPEVIDGKNYDANAVDVFSFGILLCEIVSGLQVEELPRDEDQPFAHMGIGAMDVAALKNALTPFVEEGAPQSLVNLALKAISPNAQERPGMESIMVALGKLASAHRCPDLMDLHADMHAVTALEKEVETYVERFRALEKKSGGSERVSSHDLT